MDYSIFQFKKDFPDEDACLEELFRRRFSSIKVCPKCGRESNFYRVRGRKCYACQFCSHQLHPLAGTIFHKSPTPLWLWFYAIYLFSNSRNGISAKELQRCLGCTYKTAWRMANSIRSLMEQDDDTLNKTVEIDETYIGGKRRQSRKSENKSMIVGMVQRGGRAKAKYMKEYWTPTVLKNLTDNVEVGTRLITDESCIMKKVDRLGYLHDSIKHSSKEYVRGDVYTNTIEGFWSLVKRSLDGTYHAVSKKYLQNYINEFTFYYNQRLSSIPVFENLLRRLCKQNRLEGQSIVVPMVPVVF